jgi:hypothetical protein
LPPCFVSQPACCRRAADVDSYECWSATPCYSALLTSCCGFRCLAETAALLKKSKAGELAVAPPAPRSAHAAASYLDRYLLIFGGEARRCVHEAHSVELLLYLKNRHKSCCMHCWECSLLALHCHAQGICNCHCLLSAGGSLSSCFSDVAVLDTETKQWLTPPIVGAKGVSPRAGHSGAIVGSAWYIVGGGNNVKGEYQAVIDKFAGWGPVG